MCRNIRPLYNFEPPATEEEVRAAALQYVRKISGFTKPSRANEAAFNRAVEAVAHASMHLLADLQTTAPPKDREAEAAKRRALAAHGRRDDRRDRGLGGRRPVRARGARAPRARRVGPRPDHRATRAAPAAVRAFGR